MNESTKQQIIQAIKSIQQDESISKLGDEAFTLIGQRADLTYLLKMTLEAPDRTLDALVEDMGYAATLTSTQDSRKAKKGIEEIKDLITVAHNTACVRVVAQTITSGRRHLHMADADAIASAHAPVIVGFAVLASIINDAGFKMKDLDMARFARYTMRHDVSEMIYAYRPDLGIWIPKKADAVSHDLSVALKGPLAVGQLDNEGKFRQASHLVKSVAATESLVKSFMQTTAHAHTSDSASGYVSYDRLNRHTGDNIFALFGQTLYSTHRGSRYSAVCESRGIDPTQLEPSAMKPYDVFIQGSVDFDLIPESELDTPAFDKYFSISFPMDQNNETRDYACLMIALALFQCNHLAQVGFNLVGEGGGGKSLLTSIIKDIVNRYYLASESKIKVVDELDINGETRFWAKDALQSKMIVVSESTIDSKQALSRFKALTGHDAIKIERKNSNSADTFSFKGLALLATNERIHPRYMDKALAQRLRVLEFTVNNRTRKQEGSLDDSYLNDIPGEFDHIVSRAFYVLKRTLETGDWNMYQPEHSKKATASQIDSSDPFTQFMTDCVLIDPEYETHDRSYFYKFVRRSDWGVEIEPKSFEYVADGERHQIKNASMTALRKAYHTYMMDRLNFSKRQARERLNKDLPKPARSAAIKIYKATGIQCGSTSKSDRVFKGLDKKYTYPIFIDPTCLSCNGEPTPFENMPSAQNERARLVLRASESKAEDTEEGDEYDEPQF